MATYLEIRELCNDSELRNRCEAAVIVSAIKTLASNPTVQQRELISKVLSSTKEYASKASYSLVVANMAKTKTEILALSDTAIQAVVDAAALNLVTDIV